MNRLITLVRREYWENRGTFFKIPIVFSVFVILIGICALITNNYHPLGIQIEGKPVLGNTIPAHFINDLFAGMALPYMIVLGFILFYYFLGSLYDDRKDRSYLFWLSMPISQTETQLSKIMAGIIVAPLCTWFCIIITEFIFLIIMTIASSLMGINQLINLWNIGAIFITWFKLLAVLYLQALWLFPLFAWCMLCSAYAKKSPFLTAIIPILALFIIELIFVHTGVVYHYVVSRFSYAAATWATLLQPLTFEHNLTFTTRLSTLHYISLYWSLGIGAVFIVIASLLRFSCYRFDDN